MNELAGKRRRRKQKRRLTIQHVEERRMFAALPTGTVELGDDFAPTYDTVATRSGNFDDPRIWSNGVPRRGSNFNIREGVDVTIRSELTPRINFGNVRGSLSFQNNRDTRLRIETLRVETGGRLQVGTPANPINADRTAEIEFGAIRVGAGENRDDRNGFSPDDTNFFGLGLLVQPQAEFLSAGQFRSADVSSARLDNESRDSFRRRSDSIIVNGNASTFNVGDEITIAPTRFGRDEANQTETVRIRAIRQLPRRIEGRPAFQIDLGRPEDHTQPYRLRYDHRNIRGQATNVVNLTRNVVFRTDDAGTNFRLNGQESFQRRGHVFLQSQDVRIVGTEFRDLGRTDNRLLSEDNGRDGVRIRAENGQQTNAFVAGTRDGIINQRGRNALKFSRTLDVTTAQGEYVYDASNLARVTGSVVNGAPGWGFINHSSGVDFINNVAVGVVGSAFTSSAGNEIGSFRGNVAIDGDGNGSVVDRIVEAIAPTITGDVRERFEAFTLSRFGRREGLSGQEIIIRHGDQARTGEGFWIQSPGVTIVDNVAAGFDGRGFAIYNLGTFETDREEEAGFRQDLIDWGDRTYRIWDNPGTFQDDRAVIQNLALREFEGNTAYASFLGLQVRFSGSDNRTFSQSFRGVTENSPRVRNNRFNREGLTIENFTSVRNEIGLSTSYVTNATFNNVSVLNDGRETYGYAVFAQNNIQDEINFNDLVIRGYRSGIDFQGNNPDFGLNNPDVRVTNPTTEVRFRPDVNNPGNRVRTFALNQLPSDSDRGFVRFS